MATERRPRARGDTGGRERLARHARAPAPTLAARRKTRQLLVGKVGVGGDHPISVQSMTTTLTADIDATLQQIAELTASGCDIVRVACPSQDDADALPAIARKSQIPVVADIHFQPKYVFAAIEAGCAAVRVNPGNIRKFDDQVKEIAAAARDHGTPSGSGSTPGRWTSGCWTKYGKATPEALVESALWEAGLFAEHDFHDIKISVKHNDPVVMVRAYEILAEACDYPLHLGVTEAGPAFQGTIKSAVRSVRCCARASATPSGCRCRRPRRGGQGRHADPAVAQPAAAQAGDRVLPVVRARPGRRLPARRRGHGRAGPGWRCRAGRGDGLRGQRAGGGARGRPRGGLGQWQGPDLRPGGRSSRPCRSTRSWRP